MDNVHVAIRVRPLITRESTHDLCLHWKVDNNSICQVDSKNKVVGKPYTFDYVFHMGQSTNDVYSQVAEPIIESAMDGYDGTIFAYGQTSSGKTFTMQGNDKEPGIIPKAIAQIFATIDKSPDREFLLRVCYMEIYNEVITDLLCKDGKGLNIREQEKRVFVSGLTEEVVNNADMILELMKKGDQQRHVGRTNMNEHSSRSHTIFCTVIESRERTNSRQSYDGAVKVARLNLVDLAGSERLADTKAEGMRLKEACKINQSLFALGQVINKLSSGVEYIPFRDSKLTRILQPSLGGNAKTAIICTVTPAAVDQTHSTLQFASRAKTIKNKPEMHEILSDEALLRRYKSEIEKLKKQIDENDGSDKLKDGWESLQNEKKQMAEQNQKLIEARNRLEMMVISGHGGSNQKTKKRPNRRETWCPGTRKFPLLASDPIAAAAAVSAEVGTLNVSDFMMPPRANTSSSSSISSDEFSESKLEAFAVECRFPDDSGVPKKKRRRAVHFPDIPASLMEGDGTVAQEVGCQTEAIPTSHEELQESIIICEALMDEKEQLKNYNELMTEQIGQLKDENQEVNARCIAIELERDQMKLELSHVREEFLELQEFTSIEQEVNDDHYKDVELTHQTAIKELNETIGVKENEIQNLRRSICFPQSTQLPSNQQTEHQLLDEKVKDLEKSLEDAETVVMDTNKSLSEMKDRNVQLEHEMESLKKKLQQLENEKSDFEACFAIQKEKSDHMCGNLRTELQMTYRQLAEAKGEEVMTSVHALQEIIERLTKESETMKEDLQLSITSSVDIQEDLITCQEVLEARSNECKALQEVLDARVQDCETLRVNMVSLQEELEQVRNAPKETLQGELESCDLQESLNASVQESKTPNIKVLSLQEELEQATLVPEDAMNDPSDISELQMCLNAKTQECEALNGMMVSLQEQLEAATVVPEEAMNDPSDISELQMCLNAKTQECEALNGMVVSLQEELEEATVVPEEAINDPSDISELQMCLNAKTQECEALNGMVVSLQEQQEEATVVPEEAMNDPSDISELQMCLNAKTQECEALNGMVVSLQEQLEAATVVPEEAMNDPSDISELQMCLNAKTQECETLNGMVVSLQEQLEEATLVPEEAMNDPSDISELQMCLNAKTQECETLNGMVISLQEQLEEATVVPEEAMNDPSDISELQMCLNAKTQECEALNGMVVSLQEQLEEAIISTECNSVKDSSTQPGDGGLDLEISDLEQELKMRKEYEVELESEIEMLKEQLGMFNSLGKSDMNLREELMDAIVGTESKVSDMASENPDTAKQNETSQRADDSSDENDTIPPVSETNEVVEEPNADQNIKEKISLESKVMELQEKLTEMSERLTEMSQKVDDSEEMLKIAKDYEAELERQLEEASKNNELRDGDVQTLQDQMKMLNSEKTVLQAAMAETESKLADMESKLVGSAANFTDLESKLTGSESKFVDMESTLIESETKFADMESKLADSETKFADLMSNLADSEAKVDQWKGEAEMSKRLMTEQSMSTDLMSTQLETYRQTADRAKGALLADSNRELEQQRRIGTLQNAQKESVAVFQQASKEKDEVIGGLEKKARDLLTKLRQAESQSDQATHRCLQMDRECQELRDRVKELENHAFEKSSHSNLKQEMDPAKLAQRMKQLEFNLDITKQKSDKFEKLNKELKESNKKYEANEFKASNLEKQLRDVNFELERERTQFSQLKSRYDFIIVEVAEVKHRLAKSELKSAGVDIESMKNDLCILEKENFKMKERAIMSDQKLLQLENAVEIEKKRHGQAQHDIKTVQEELQYCKATIHELELEREHLTSKMEKNGKHFNGVCQELEDELQSCKKELTNHQERLEEAKLKSAGVDIERMKDNLCILEKENFEMKEKVSMSDQKLLQLENEVEIEKKRHGQAQHDMKTVQDELEYCKTTICELESEREHLRSKMAKNDKHLTGVCQELEEELQSCKKELTNYQERLEEAKLKSAGVDIERMRNDFCTLEKENFEMKERVSMSDQKLQQLENEVAIEKKRHEQSQHDMKTVQDELEYCKTTIHELESEREHFRSKMENNEKHFNGVCQDFEDEIQACKKELTNYQERLDEAMLKSAGVDIERMDNLCILEKENFEMKEKVSMSDQKLLQLENEVEIEKKRHEQAQHDMKTVQDELEYCKTTIHELESEREHFRSKMENNEKHFNGVCQEFEEELQSCKKELTNYQERLEEAKLKSAGVDIERMKHNLCILEKENFEMKEKVSMSDQKLLHLENEVEIEKKRHEQAQHDMKTVQDELQYCKTTIRELESEGEHLTSKMEKNEKHFNGVCQEFEDEIRSYKKELTNYQEQLEEAKLKSAGVDIERMKNNLCTLEKENFEMKEKVSMRDQKLLQLENEVEIEKKRHEQAQHDMKTVQDELEYCKTTIHELESEREHLTSKMENNEKHFNGMCQEFEDEVQAYKKELTNYQEQLEEAKLKSAGVDIERMKNNLCILEKENFEMKEKVSMRDQKLLQLENEVEIEKKRHEQAQHDMKTVQNDALQYMTKMEKLKEEKELANDKLREQEMNAARNVGNIQQEHQHEIDTLKCTLDDLRIELASVHEKSEAAEEDDWALSRVCNDLKLELEQERQQSRQNQEVLKEQQAKCANMQSKIESQTKRIEVLKRHERELEKLCDEIQEEQEEEERQHKQTKAKVKELEATLEEKKMLVERSTLKKLQEDLVQKKMKIVTLQSEILKCTDPLDKRISQLTKELAESTEKVQSWKTEAKRLRQSSLDNSAESNASSSRTEAGYGSGIIQECAVFTLKAEKAKLEVELKRSKAKAVDLEKKFNEKCIFYQEEITRNTRLRAELKRYVEKSKVTKEQAFMKAGAQKRALNDVPRNSPVKKASKIHKESLPTSTSTNKTKADDLTNFLLPAIDKLNEDEPQQCAQQ